MSTDHIEVFMPIIIFAILGAVITIGGHLVSRLLSPHKPSELKETPYECGEFPTGSAWSAFNVRFYVVGLIFIIFDVESALMFPAAAVFRKFNDIGEGTAVVVIFLLFISIFVEGIVYCWKKGDLDWIRSFQAPKEKK